MDAHVRLPDRSYALRRALLVYESAGTDPPLVTAHDVVHAGNGQAGASPGGAGPAYLGAGRRFEPDVARALLRRMAETPRHTGGLLPERVLYCDPERLLWYRPAAPRALHFDSKSAALNALSGKPLPHPRLLFLVKGSQLSVWAVRWLGRPRPDTILYHAPYFNVGHGGDVCHGSMRAPAEAVPDSIAAWEDAFFESAFTHGGGVRFLRGPEGYATTMAWLARALERGTPARFPTGRLVRTGQRLMSLL